jgi:hypothetical protein
MKRVLIGGLWGMVACGPSVGMDDGAIESAETGGSDAGIVGVWVGYANDAPWFQSGSDRVELEIVRLEPDGRIEGAIAFGEPGMLPPATDPDVGYPEGYTSNTFAVGGFVELLEPFTYTVEGVYEEGMFRLRAEFLRTEPWAQWCSLQTPHPDTTFCIPNCGTTYDDGHCELFDCADAGPIDCSKMSLCRTEACHCEPSGCMHSPESKNALDLHRSGDELQGPIGGMGTAYLFRQ